MTDIVETSEPALVEPEAHPPLRRVALWFATADDASAADVLTSLAARFAEGGVVAASIRNADGLEIGQVTFEPPFV